MMKAFFIEKVLSKMLFRKKHWQKTLFKKKCYQKYAFYRKNAYGVFTEKALAKNTF